MSFNAASIRLMAEKGLSALDIAEIAEAAFSAPCFPEKEWQDLRAATFARDGYKCTYCGSTEDLCCDHVIPLVQGGPTTLDNLTTACRPCNGGKSGRTPQEWRR